MNGPGFGFTEPEDQVRRLRRFRHEHPDIKIAVTDGEWVATRHGKVLASAIELGWLLDDLSRLTDEQGHSRSRRKRP